MSLSSQLSSATSSSPITFLRLGGGGSSRRSKIASVFSLPIAASPPHLRALAAKPLGPKLVAAARSSRLGVYDSDDAGHRNDVGRFNFDSFLSIAELACLVSSAILTIGLAANWKRAIWGFLGDRVWVWGLVTMVCGVLIGAVIRRRQWSRICVETVKGGGESFSFVDRIERLEGDLRSSTAIVRALSRQLEKLGIRFRVTRKSLKDPIAETAALAQKNSEATRLLAMQEDILEKELSEVHNVLLAMQEQQHKQLDLIIAIGKAGKLFGDEEIPEQEHDTKETPQPDQGMKQIEAKEMPQPNNGLEQISAKENPQPGEEVEEQTRTSPTPQALENGMLGSNTPSCYNKCSMCHPCMAVQVPTMPTHIHNQNQNQPKTRPKMEDLDPSPSQSNYKPLGWKCRCGDHIFNP